MNTSSETEIVNSQNDTIEEVPELDENESDVEVIKAHAKKLEDNNKQLFARTKKAEGFVQDSTGKWVKPAKPVEKVEKKPEATIEKKDSEISQTDLIFVAKSDIPREDINDLVEYAKFKGVSLEEASNDPIMKGILAGKAEQRKVADGTNTGGGKRGNAKVSDEGLVANALKGELPDNDADMARLSILMRARK